MELARHHMFPTHVGMNRQGGLVGREDKDVPHTRGDEPKVCTVSVTHRACSPHTWG